MLGSCRSLCKPAHASSSTQRLGAILVRASIKPKPLAIPAAILCDFYAIGAVNAALIRHCPQVANGTQVIEYQGHLLAISEDPANRTAVLRVWLRAKETLHSHQSGSSCRRRMGHHLLHFGLALGAWKSLWGGPCGSQYCSHRAVWHSTRSSILKLSERVATSAASPALIGVPHTKHPRQWE